MRMFGFSTGSIVPGDAEGALRILLHHDAPAVELSALRITELPALLGAAPTLPVDGFQHVSVHLPSKFAPEDDSRIAEAAHAFVRRGWPVVLHPDVICDDAPWRSLGAHLWIENMDKRKPIGRTAAELDELFARFPDAGLCLDVAHSRQVDPTMRETRYILRAHGNRVRQVHLSEVGSSSRHAPLSFGAIHDFSGIASLIPVDAPVILESPVSEDEIATELERAREALPDDSLIHA